MTLENQPVRVNRYPTDEEVIAFLGKLRRQVKVFKAMGAARRSASEALLKRGDAKKGFDKAGEAAGYLASSTIVSDVVEDLMRLYGLEDETDLQEGVPHA